MPVHDWTRVDAGIFHAFHHDWITEIARALNRGLLPPSYYALPEQHAAGLGPDVLTLQGTREGEGTGAAFEEPSGGVTLAPPKLLPVAETELAFYRRKQNHVTVRHVSGDEVIAVMELVSPGNKSSRSSMQAFVQKVAELIELRIHVLIVDLHPPGLRDPRGIHAEIWEEIAGEQQTTPGKPLILAANECALSVRAYVVPVGYGEVLADMPLFLKPSQSVEVPLEATYNAAFADIPRRWRSVLDAP